MWRRGPRYPIWEGCPTLSRSAKISVLKIVKARNRLTTQLLRAGSVCERKGS
jgi:hypothetical protein